MQNENKNTENYDEIIRAWETKNSVHEPFRININYTKITHIPYFPKCIDLDLSLSPDMCRHLPEFPQSLQILNFNIIHTIVNSNIVFSALPHGLRELYWYGANNPLPDLPLTLKILYIDSAPLNMPLLPPNLEALHIFGGEVRKLPPLPDSLKKLKIEMTVIRHLPPLPPNLEELSCSENDLVCLPDLPPKLKLLECVKNRITRLPALPPCLKELTCFYNKITDYPTYHADLDVIDDRYPGLYQTCQ